MGAGIKAQIKGSKSGKDYEGKVLALDVKWQLRLCGWGKRRSSASAETKAVAEVLRE